MLKPNHSQDTSSPSLPPFRFQVVRDLLSGEAASLIVQHREGFDERVRFGRFETPEDGVQPDPALWLAERVERAAFSEAMAPGAFRPIFVPAPDAAFEHENTPMACRAAVARSQLLPQEFCLEFTDAALVLAREEAERHVRAFRRRGFRVSLDLRRSQHSALSHALRLMLDTIRVRAEDIARDEVSRTVEAAVAAGVCVIAEGPYWRDAEALARQGIAYALEPKADA